MQRRNREEKAALLYDYLDQSKLFRGTVRARGPLAHERTLQPPGDADLDAAFVASRVEPPDSRT